MTQPVPLQVCFHGGGSLKKKVQGDPLQTHIHKCKHTDTHNSIPHCDCPAQLVTQAVGPSKVPFRGNGESRGGGGGGGVTGPVRLK